MKLRIALAIGTLLLLVGQAPAASADDSRAREIAARSFAAMGGQAAWEATRLVHFDWAVVRDGESVARYRHWWDRWTGEYRLEGKTRDGDQLLVRFNVGSREGVAQVAGEMLEGEAAAEQLERAYGRFINDSYWILMPWKWLDPGVRLTYEGERDFDGRSFDVVKLEFGEEIGLTSNDRYYAWVARDSGLMERWQYVLEDEKGAPGQGEASAWEWTDWQETASGLRVSTAKHRHGGDAEVSIVFPLVDFRARVTDQELATIFSPR